MNSTKVDKKVNARREEMGFGVEDYVLFFRPETRKERILAKIGDEMWSDHFCVIFHIDGKPEARIPFNYVGAPGFIEKYFIFDDNNLNEPVDNIDRVLIFRRTGIGFGRLMARVSRNGDMWHIKRH